MELGLSLGDASSKSLGFIDSSTGDIPNKGLGFCMGLSSGFSTGKQQQLQLQLHGDDDDDEDEDKRNSTTTPTSTLLDSQNNNTPSMDPPVQLDLLPNTPVPRYPPSLPAFPWPSDNGKTNPT